jgi:hypothetical protein
VIPEGKYLWLSPSLWYSKFILLIFYPIIPPPPINIIKLYEKFTTYQISVKIFNVCNVNTNARQPASTANNDVGYFNRIAGKYISFLSMCDFYIFIER